MRISTSQFLTQGVNGILDLQSSVNLARVQLTEGTKIINPSDDPVGASKIIILEQEIHITNQYQENIASVERNLALEETAISNFKNSLGRVRELVLQGNNATLSVIERRSIAVEVRERLAEMVSLANTKSGTGGYLFAGYQSATTPFTQDAAGNYAYNGDEGQRLIKIGSSTNVVDNDSGKALFMAIAADPNTYKVNSDQTNTGGALVATSKISDPDAWKASVPETYTISFNALNPGSNFDVYADSAPGVPLPGFDDVTFTSGDKILVSGVELQISGTPDPGDTFHVSSVNQQDIFTSIDKIANAFESFGDSEIDVARLNFEATIALNNLDKAQDHLSVFQAKIGTRMNVAESQENVNLDFLQLTEQTLSTVRDLDMVEAITRLNSQTIALQAAQQAYSRVQGLSLFNFL